MLKREIIFIKPFYSNTLGRVWPDRAAYVSIVTAKNLVNSGLAVYAKKKDTK